MAENTNYPQPRLRAGAGSNTEPAGGDSKQPRLRRGPAPNQTPPGAQNLVEKIAQCYARGLKPGARVRSGDYLSIQPEHVLTHDNSAAVMNKFTTLGAARMANPRQPVFALDHNVQDQSKANREKYAQIEAFARRMGVDFYPAGRGIGHQVMCEEGYAFPGTMVVASDSHANMYGGLGCLGTPVVRTDAAAIWATGRTWWQIPPVARVELTGSLRPGVSGKDVIITLAGYFNHDEALNLALEFGGPGIRDLSISDRLTIANMTTEWGALVGLFPVDERTLEWLYRRAAYLAQRGPAGVPSDGGGPHPRLNRERIQTLEENLPDPDREAGYDREIILDLSTVRPQVAGPNQVKTITPAAELATVKIDKAYLVSCVNSRVADLAAAAEVVRGKQVAKGVEFYIAAASDEVQSESERRGEWQALLKAGARPLPPGCGPCIGLGAGLLEAGEVGISATNRNFRGRMGSPQAETYLASPAVVAASALAGRIADPSGLEAAPIQAAIVQKEGKPAPAEKMELLDGFPQTLQGELVFCRQDNLNTDGIYPGKYTYREDFTPQDQARVAMENYDPEFQNLAREGDILVGGFNFGSGSSREQAATALKYRGIQLILAGSCSQTYKRNALNNGFLVLEVPGLVRDLQARWGAGTLTVRTGLKAQVDFSESRLATPEKSYALPPLGAAAQELILEGGLENWVIKRMDI